MISPLRLAFRSLLRDPVFAAAALASLALGIGANATIFSAIDAVLLAGPPGVDGGPVMVLYQTDPARTVTQPVSRPNAEDLARWSESFSGLAIHRTVSVALGDEAPEILFGEVVSSPFFEVLGVDLQAGRGFTEAEGEPAAAPGVVVLSHDLWQRRFEGRGDLVGQTIRLNGQAFEVIGIAPPRFRGTELLEGAELWVPTGDHRAVLTGPALPAFDQRGVQMFDLVGRLAPGVAPEEAVAELDNLAGRLRQLDPAANDELHLTSVPLRQASVDPARRQVFTRAGWILALVVGLLLLVAAANLASLLLARSIRRQQEMGVRLALGARRGQLVSQLLVEALVLGLLGAAAGLLLAAVGVRVLWALRPPFLTGLDPLTVGWPVVAFAFGVGLATTLVFALAPALRSTRPDLATALGAGRPGSGASRETHRWLAALVAFQVALCTVALIGTTLFVGSLRNLQAVDLGFEPDGLFLVPVNLGVRGYSEAAAMDFFQRAVERIEALPEVSAAALSERPVLAPGGNRRQIAELEGSERSPGSGLSSQRLQVPVSHVGPGYLETMGISLVLGRDLSPRDRADGPPVALINGAAAELFWPGEDPVGRRLRFRDTEGWIQVVGVTENVQVHGIGQEVEPYVYLAAFQAPSVATILHVRASGETAAAIPAVRGVLETLEPGIPLLEAREVSALLDRATWAPRIMASLLGLFSLLALTLAALGIYGVVTYSMTVRTREMGLRMALGADRPRLVRRVLGQGMLPVALGLGAGLALAALATPRIAPLLFELGPHDPAAFGITALVLLVVGAAAVALPARRATGLDPAAVLRDP